MRKILTMTASIGVVCSAAPTAGALTCAYLRPPVAEVIYPARRNVVVARNSVIFVRTRLKVRDFILKDITGKRSVPLRGRRTKLTGLLIVQPRKPLPANRVFQLTLRPKAARPARGRIMPSILARFKTGPKTAKTAAPRLKRPRMTFSAVKKRAWVGVGRTAHVVVRARSTAKPAVVEVTRVFRTKRGNRKQTNRRKFSQAYTHPRTRVFAASMGKCSRIGKAPPKGHYGVTVVPWSSTGKKGKAVKRSGRIK